MNSDKMKEIYMSSSDDINGYKPLPQVWDKHLQIPDICITQFIGKFNNKTSRMVKVISGDKTFEGEVTQLCWDADQWVFMVDGEWYCQSEVYELGHSDLK